jgi:hypothetical protein
MIPTRPSKNTARIGTCLIIGSAYAAVPCVPLLAANPEDPAMNFPGLPVFDEVAQDEIGNTDEHGNRGNIADYLHDIMRVLVKPAAICASFFLHPFPLHRLPDLCCPPILIVRNKPHTKKFPARSCRSRSASLKGSDREPVDRSYAGCYQDGPPIPAHPPVNDPGPCAESLRHHDTPVRASLPPLHQTCSNTVVSTCFPQYPRPGITG